MKDFDSWNLLKKKIDDHPKGPLFKEGEVWWVNCGLNIGYEIDGKGELFLRPFIIIKKNDSNSSICVPLTKNLSNRNYYFRLEIKGLIISCSLSQIKTIDSRRLFRKHCEISSSKLKVVKDEILNYFINPSGAPEGRG